MPGKPLSANIVSPGSTRSKNPEFTVIKASEHLPQCASEWKHIVPQGVIATRNFSVSSLVMQIQGPLLLHGAWLLSMHLGTVNYHRAAWVVCNLKQSGSLAWMTLDGGRYIHFCVAVESDRRMLLKWREAVVLLTENSTPSDE